MIKRERELNNNKLLKYKKMLFFFIIFKLKSLKIFIIEAHSLI
jgi:hypothetical protein